MDERAVDRAPIKKEQRKDSRLRVTVPVVAKWQDAGGKSINEPGQAKEVNTLGGLLDMKAYPLAGSELELTNLLSGEATQARVVAVRRSKKGVFLGIAIALKVPSETFWGLNFRLKRTSAELVKIEQGIKSGGVEPRILAEFRDAVDYVRRTAWAVQEWQERQLQEHDPQTVLPLIITERIRRATQLSKAIMKDFAADEVTRETAGIEEFFPAIEGLYLRVVDLFKDREA